MTLLSVLLKCEWSASAGWSHEEAICPICMEEPFDGHADGCRLAEQIVLAGGTPTVRERPMYKAPEPGSQAAEQEARGARAAEEANRFLAILTAAKSVVAVGGKSPTVTWPTEPYPAD